MTLVEFGNSLQLRLSETFTLYPSVEPSSERVSGFVSIPGTAVRFLREEVEKLYNVLLCERSILPKEIKSKRFGITMIIEATGTPGPMRARRIHESVVPARTFNSWMFFQTIPTQMKAFGASLAGLFLRPAFPPAKEKTQCAKTSHFSAQPLA